MEVALLHLVWLIVAGGGLWRAARWLLRPTAAPRTLDDFPSVVDGAKCLVRVDLELFAPGAVRHGAAYEVVLPGPDDRAGDLCERLVVDSGGTFAAAALSDASVSFFFLVSAPRRFRTLAERFLLSFPGATVRERDPDGAAFLDRMFRPNAAQRRWMANRDAVHALAEQGDTPEAARRIVHLLSFPDEAALARALEKLPDSFTRVRTGCAPGSQVPVFVEVSHVGPVLLAHIQALTMALEALTQAENGRYGGWRAPVARGVRTLH